MTAHRAGGGDSTPAARPTGRTASLHLACCRRAIVLTGLPSRSSTRNEAGRRRWTGLPSRSSTRKEAGRSGAKAGVPDGTHGNVVSHHPACRLCLTFGVS